jgi:signal transduction histidine kinase
VIRVLLVDDDEDDWLLVRDALLDVGPERYSVDWAATWEDGLKATTRSEHDVYLVDYRLGERDGLELIRQTVERGRVAPMILLTGVQDEHVDSSGAMVGAADYLVKQRLDGELLDRSIRYAVERHRAEERAVAVARAEVAMADAEKSRAQLQQLVATLAHDLAQPLSTIRARAQLLLRRLPGPDDAERLVNSLQQIAQTSAQMAELLSELVTASRNEGSMELDLAPADLGGIVRDALQGVEQTTDRHVFSVNLPESGPVGEWDRVRLRRVTNNLLSNAVKYSPAGGEINVRLETVHAANGDAWAELSVRDSGLGIPTADLPHVFEPFHRGSNAAGAAAGTGIGLSSVRQIVQAHRGTVQVESTEGRGSVFTVRLPVSSFGGGATQDGAQHQ